MCAKILKYLSVACLLLAIATPRLWGQAPVPTPADTLDPYQRLIDASFVAGDRGDYELAERCLRDAMEVRPDHPLNAYLLNNLAGLQELQGKRDEALLSYSAALERNQDEQTVRYNRARLYLAMDQRRAALTDYSILVAQAPKNELYKYQRAMLYIWEKGYDQAELDLSDIIRDNPASLKARIGYALLETMRGRYAEAERLYDYLLTKLPHSAEVYEGRARLYLLMDKRGFALRDVQRAIELAGAKPTPSLYRLRADIALAMGEKKQAEEALKRAESLQGSNK